VQDPVLNKLKADAGIVLADLWRVFRHQTPVEAEEWQLPRSSRSATDAADMEAEKPSQSGLCYFFLN
jgi:hypothetical protein